jgi:hypothetical protein
MRRRIDQTSADRLEMIAARPSSSSCSLKIMIVDFDVVPTRKSQVSAIVPRSRCADIAGSASSILATLTIKTPEI